MSVDAKIAAPGGSPLDDPAPAARLSPLPDRPRPVVLPAYGATQRQRNLAPLLTLLLKRYGVPVVVHGPDPDDVDRDPSGAPPRVSTAAILREIGVMPAASIADAQAALRRDDLVLVPLHVLAPALAERMRAERATREEARWLARLLDPFQGGGYRILCGSRANEMTRLRTYVATAHADALLVENSEGEPFPDESTPRLEPYVAGLPTEEVPAERADALPLPPLSAAATAEWTEEVLAGAMPVPAPILAALGCCLAGVRG